MPTFEATQKGYRALWSRAEIKAAKQAQAHAVAVKIIAHRAAYEVSKVPWFLVGALHYRESDLDFNTYLGNGQSLSRVTTEVPRGRGPFASFKAGTLDALEIQGFTSISSWSIEHALYAAEEFNGWGYEKLHNENSPYIWAGTTLEQPGKYDRDGHFDPSLRDPQLGIAAVLIAIAMQDAEVAVFCQKEDTTVGPHDPLPPQKPKPVPPEPPVVQTTGGHTVIDLTQIEKDVDISLAFVEKVLPFIAWVNPSVASFLTAAIAGVRKIESELGVSPAAALAQAQSHVTPGAPNSEVLKG